MNENFFNLAEIAMNIPSNDVFIAEHGAFKVSDIEIVALLICKLGQRATGYPRIGDSVEYISATGDVYKTAQIRESEPDVPSLVVSLRNTSVFVGERAGHLYYNISTGFCQTVEKEQVNRNGEEIVEFWTWGHAGMRRHGGIHFRAKVPRWSYKFNLGYLAPYYNSTLLCWQIKGMGPLAGKFQDESDCLKEITLIKENKHYQDVYNINI